MTQRSYFYRKCLGFMLAALLLTGAVQSADRPSSSKAISADPRSAYVSIKSILAGEKQSKWTASDRICPSDVKAKQLRVLCCTGSVVFYVKGPLRRALIEIAFNVLRTQSAMSANQIPAEYWQASLSQYEDSSLRAIKEKHYIAQNSGDPELSYFDFSEGDPDRDPFANMIKEISQAVRSRGLDLDISLGGCGGPANKILIKTSPPGGTVYLLPRLFYLYCRQRGIDADDMKQCDHWLPPLHTPEESYVGGVYRYRIEWPDKRSLTNEFDSDRHTVEAVLR
jgi:hypothetical protein